MSELGSAMPTSGGLYYWTFKFSPPQLVIFFSSFSYFTFTMLIKKTGTVTFCRGLSDVRLDFIPLIVL